MISQATALTTLSEVRRAVRRLAHAHRLPAEERARLTLSVALAARAATADGRGVRLTAVTESDGHTGSGTLTVTLHTAPGVRHALPQLPLPAEQSAADGRTAWHLTLPPTSAGAGGDVARRAAAQDDEEAAEEELRAVLDRADSLAADHRRLTHELDETNSGVLALYVELEERDEQLRRAHGRMLRELEDALRPPPLTVPGLELAVHYAPADPHAPTGGDLYDWFTLPDGTVHITVVDALGHGVRSTRSALNVTHAVRTLTLEGHPLKSVIRRADEILSGLDTDLMATVLLARIDPATGDLTLAGGSHPPALLVRRDGDAGYLETRGRGIGFPLPGSEEHHTTRLAPGDLLMLYTDGLTESRRDPLEGEVRLATTAAEHRAAPIAEVPSAVADAMHTVVLHPDDTLALALRLRPDDVTPPASPTVRGHHLRQQGSPDRQPGGRGFTW